MAGADDEGHGDADARRDERRRTTTGAELDRDTYESVLGATVGSDDFDAEATVALAQHNTSRKSKAQARSEEVEAILVSTAEDAAFGARGLDFQTAGLLEKRLLHTSDLSAEDFRELDGGQVEGGLNERAIPGRYDVMDVLGEGATGQVFAAEDNNLGRQVAVKFLHPEDAADGDKMARFVKEAQVTSRLEHPNILPVFDFDLTDGGLAFFTMRKAAGTTLFDAIKRSERDGHCAPEIATFNDRVAIMLKVCDAIAYAHDRGIIHQDIKPSNIMLGEHAAVVLVDWGTALTPEDRAADKVPLMGTPAYMAPEQARRESVDERSDIYCLGATFFQLLTLRYPTWAEDPDSFWEMKRAGIVQPPDDAEQRIIPGALLDIALKAMAVDPTDRYATVEAMRRDLLNFQEGLSVSAHQDTLGELLRRWYRLNRKAVWVAAAALVLIAGLGAFYAYEKAKEQTTWHPFAVDGFDYTDNYKLDRDWVGTGFPNWRVEQMKPLPSDSEAWTLRDGRLEILASDRTASCVNLAYRRALPDDFRVRWIATPLDTSANVNCFLGNRDRSDAYVFHVGGFGQPGSVTLTKGPELRRIERRQLAQPLVPGRSYRFRLERRGNRVSLGIDGAVVLVYDDPDLAIGPGQNSFGFEVGVNRVAIDQVEIEYLPLAQKIDPIAVADSFYARRHYREAYEQYDRIRDLYPQTQMAIRASYRLGRCLAGMERPEDAIAALSLFAVEHPTHPLADHARFDLATIALEQEDWTALEASLDDLAAGQPTPAMRRAASLVAEDYIRRRFVLGDELLFTEDPIPTLVAALDQLDHWRDRLGDPRLVGGSDSSSTLRGRIGDMLGTLGAYDVILERYAHEDGRVFNALLGMGRYAEAERRFADHPGLMFRFLTAQGRFAEALERFPEATGESARQALLELGRFDEARRRFPHDLSEIRVAELIAAGDLDGALAAAEPGSPDYYDVMWMLGRYEETRGATWSWRDQQMNILLGQPERTVVMRNARAGTQFTMAYGALLMDAVEADDDEALARWRAELDALPLLETYDPFHRLLLPVLIDTFRGDRGALARAADELRRRGADRYHGYIGAALDRIDGEPVPIPVARGTYARAPLLDGIHHELAGDPAAAIASYREHLATTDDWRPSSRFAAWRLRGLGAE